MKIRRVICFIIVLVLLAVMLSACKSKEPVKEETESPEIALSFTPETYPRVDGSTATIPLSEAFAAKLMDMELEEARQYIVHNTTHNAYVNLIDGNANIIFVTSPSEGELAYAKDKGIRLEVVPIVSEGFVFLSSKDNPVTNLSLQQIQDIYAGIITNWKEVGGKDKAIIPYQREENSGSQTGMLDLVIGPDKIMDPPKERVIGAMGELVDAVAVYTNEEDAIGYSYYYYVTDMWKNKEVKLLAVDGVYPDGETISNGTYPIQTAYYAVMRTDEPEGSEARMLLEWILSEQGQLVAEEAGYVKLGQ